MSQPWTVLVTGASGQDGSYLTARLAAEGHLVHGLCRTKEQADRLVREVPDVEAHIGNLLNTDAIRSLVKQTKPTVVFNLAGSTSVAMSWDRPIETSDVLAVGMIRLLDACWKLNESTGTSTRFLQASSAEIFGDARVAPQTEQTPLSPLTPYGVAKACAHQMIKVYRDRGMFATSAILYNHESPRRPPSFVARKISQAVARISLGAKEPLVLGNIDVERDWGFAPDYVDAMIKIVRAPNPDDYIVATGKAQSVRDFVIAAFAHVGITDWQSHVSIDHSLYRPADPRVLVGDPTRLKQLGWAPSVTFTDLVATMVEADLKLLQAK